MGWPEAKLLPTEHNPSLECIVCLDVLKDAVMCFDCQASLCLVCLESAAMQCPQCRKPQPRPPKQNLFARRIVNALKVHCANREQGCAAQPTIETMAAHEASCEYAWVSCPHPGCGAQYPLKSHEGHVLTCGHATLKCEHCEATHKRLELATHSCVRVLKARIAELEQENARLRAGASSGTAAASAAAAAATAAPAFTMRTGPVRVETVSSALASPTPQVALRSAKFPTLQAVEVGMSQPAKKGTQHLDACSALIGAFSNNPDPDNGEASNKLRDAIIASDVIMGSVARTLGSAGAEYRMSHCILVDYLSAVSVEEERRGKTDRPAHLRLGRCGVLPALFAGLRCAIGERQYDEMERCSTCIAQLLLCEENREGVRQADIALLTDAIVAIPLNNIVLSSCCKAIERALNHPRNSRLTADRPKIINAALQIMRKLPTHAGLIGGHLEILSPFMKHRETVLSDAASAMVIEALESLRRNYNDPEDAMYAAEGALTFLTAYTGCEEGAIEFINAHHTVALAAYMRRRHQEVLVQKMCVRIALQLCSGEALKGTIPFLVEDGVVRQVVAAMHKIHSSAELYTDALRMISSVALCFKDGKLMEGLGVVKGIVAAMREFPLDVQLQDSALLALLSVLDSPCSIGNNDVVLPVLNAMLLAPTNEDLQSVALSVLIQIMHETPLQFQPHGSGIRCVASALANFATDGVYKKACTIITSVALDNDAMKCVVGELGCLERLCTLMPMHENPDRALRVLKECTYRAPENHARIVPFLPVILKAMVDSIHDIETVLPGALVLKNLALNRHLDRRSAAVFPITAPGVMKMVTRQYPHNRTFGQIYGIVNGASW